MLDTSPSRRRPRIRRRSTARRVAGTTEVAAEAAVAPEPDPALLLNGRVAELEVLLDARGAELEFVRVELAEELTRAAKRNRTDELEAMVSALEESIRVRTRERDDARAVLAHDRVERRALLDEAIRLRDEAAAFASEVVARADVEADLVRREAHVTAHGIREIAREDARQLRETVEVFGTTTDLPERIRKLERALDRHRKLLKKRAR